MAKPIVYRAFDKQIEFHKSGERTRGAFSGKRGGKTECGAVEAVRFAQEQIGYDHSPIDPYLGLIIAPTNDMLRRLSLKKFLAYGKGYLQPGAKGHNKSTQEFTFNNGSQVYGISGDRPARVEGLKAYWAWIDEVFQISEQLFLEVMARLSDTRGRLWCTGSLGVQYVNPKQHWAYKYFKEKPMPGTALFEWPTASNPYYPRDELARMAENLDPRTFRQMFTIDWDVPPTGLVYSDWSEGNEIESWKFDPSWEISMAVDWGYAHPMAVGYFAYNRRPGQFARVIQFDEIVGSRMTLEMLWAKHQEKVKSWGKDARVNLYYCDISGTQEREQTGYSNVKWFQGKGIEFKYYSSGVQYGVALVRRFVQNGLGQKLWQVVRPKCPKTIDAIRRYRYPEKNGIILNENPAKVDDDPCDMFRYYFVNRLDPRHQGATLNTFDRFGGF